MKRKKLIALVLSAALCITAVPVTGRASEFTDSVEDLEGEVSDVKEEASEVQDENGVEDLNPDNGIAEIEQKTGEDPDDGRSAEKASARDAFGDGEAQAEALGDAVSDAVENGNIELSHEGIIQEGAICPKKTDVVLTEAWEKGLVQLLDNNSFPLDISGLQIPSDQISDVLMLFLNKHPEYYWVSFESCDVENGIAVKLYKKSTPSMGKTIHGASSVEEGTEQALAVIQPGMSDLEKALALHDYLILNTEYAYDELQNGTYTDDVFTIEGILVNGTGVCQGYALTYQYLLNKVGIESVYVGSNEMNHGWNLVKIGDAWYHVDTTWDDPVRDELGRVLHTYFMLSDATIKAMEKPHYGWSVWNEESTPAAISTSYENYFWKDVQSGIWYDQGKWYYLDKSTGDIKCQEINDFSAKTLYTQTLYWWNVDKDGYYWVGNYGKTVLRNGRFYFSGPDAIYSMKLDGSDVVKETDVSRNKEYVYGFAYLNGSFWVAIHAAPNMSENETPYMVDLGSGATVIPTAKPAATATPSPTATLTPEPTATLTPEPTATATPRPTATAIPKPTVIATPKPTATATPKPTSVPHFNMTLKWTGIKWNNYNSVTIELISNKSGTMYYQWTIYGADTPKINTNGTGVKFTANKKFNITIRNINKDGKINVYVRAKDSKGTLGTIYRLRTDVGERPVKNTPTPIPSREPLKPRVNESRVVGLAEPLKFYPNTFYDVTVIGAGTDNKDPIEGDIKWVPLYWSTEANPADVQKHSSWKIGSTKGIKMSGIYNLYIFFQKWVYTKKTWCATDEVVPATYQFASAALYDANGIKTPVLMGIGNYARGIVVKWKPVYGVSGYKIYRKTSGGRWSAIKKISGSKKSSYVDTTVKNANGKTYIYTVKAYKNSRESGCNELGSTIIRLTAPAFYTPISKTAGKFTAKWKKNSAATGYQLQYSTSSTFKGAKTVTITSAKTLTKTISGQKRGKTYYIHLRCYKKSGGKTYYSTWSSTKTTKIKK